MPVSKGRPIRLRVAGPRLAAIVLMTLAGLSCSGKPAVVHPDIPRVVSLDYCADQFVLRFVPREHIAAVSPDARKYFSYMRDTYPGIPAVRSGAEDVLALSPTRVVRSYGGGPGATGFFERSGIDVVQLGFPSTLPEVRDNILRVAGQLGNAAEGERVVQEFDRRLKALNPAPGRPSVLYTTPSGVTTGPGSLVDEMMTAAGLTNFEQQPGWRDLPLERLVREQPDRLANATFGDKSTHVDPWTLARHPRAQALVRDTPGVQLEGAWTSCGAWFLIDAIEALAQSPKVAGAIVHD
ncbi:MAG: ABC transporter substrate-binding protein [Gammaproteobacteria bacterium]|nr:ABC transporter substrate-binding protein [Gammaproteobacteria bacterium]